MALIKMRYSDIDADWQNCTFLSKVLFSEMMRGKSILMEEEVLMNGCTTVR